MIKAHARILIIFAAFVFPCLSNDDESSCLLRGPITPSPQYLSIGPASDSEHDTTDNRDQTSQTSTSSQSSEISSPQAPPQFQIFERFIEKKDLPVHKQSERAKGKS